MLSMADLGAFQRMIQVKILMVVYGHIKQSVMAFKMSRMNSTGTTLRMSLGNGLVECNTCSVGMGQNKDGS